MTSMRKHFRLSDVHGVQQLAIEGTLGITRLVETLHRTILDLPAPAGKPRGGRTSGITGFVYDSVRGITRVVEPLRTPCSDASLRWTRRMAARRSAKRCWPC